MWLFLRLSIGLLVIIFGFSAQAETSQESLAQILGKPVAEITVKGLRRIEQEAVFEKVQTRVGTIVTAKQVSQDIHALFDMGHFDDISVEGQLLESMQVRLLYRVHERPVISNIVFEGNDQLSSSDLKEVLQLKEWSILDINKIREDVERLQKHYADKGYYLAQVQYEIKPSTEDEKIVVYRIRDYDKVRIKNITFLNNNHFTSEKLKGVLGETREGGFFSFLTSSGNFKESSFKQDLQRLTYWYLDHGFIKFKYDNPVVAMTDDKKWLYISIHLEEGEAYQVGKVSFSGELLFPQEDLHASLNLTSEKIFSISQRNQDLQKLTEKYQDLGYAFVNVIPKMEIHDDVRTVDIEYQFEKGNLAHFGEIRILGNTKTHDKVIRRELQIHERELYSGSKLRESTENVERLGYFAPGEVTFHTVLDKNHADVLDVEIHVKERSTGTIQLGAGYGSFQGLFLSAQIAENNLLGRGQILNFQAQYSIRVESRSFILGFTEPYTWDTLWSSGFDLYTTKYPIPNKYTIDKTGFDVRLGHPLSRYVIGSFTYRYEMIRDLHPVLTSGSSLTQAMINQDTGKSSGVTLSVVRDKRNNRFETTSGNYQSASLEVTGLGADMHYYKWILNQRYYAHLMGDLVFRNNIELGEIGGYGGRDAPQAQRFYLGGPNNMRGYQMFLLGPMGSDGQGHLLPLGGRTEFYSMFELEYPLFREAGVKFVSFFDVGNAWNQFPGGSANPVVLRTDAGFGVRWLSPMGPLRFEWGYPLSREPGEDVSVFNFSMGAPF